MKMEATELRTGNLVSSYGLNFFVIGIGANKIQPINEIQKNYKPNDH